MYLTVLGNNWPYPGRGGVCSGYLPEAIQLKKSFELYSQAKA